MNEIIEFPRYFEMFNKNTSPFRFYRYNDTTLKLSNIFNNIRIMSKHKVYRNLFRTIFNFESDKLNYSTIFRKNYVYKEVEDNNEDIHAFYFNPDNHYIRIVFKYYIPNKTYPSVYTFLFKRYKIIYDCKNDKLIFSGKKFKKINAMFDEDVFDDECVGIFDNKSLISRDTYRAIFSKYKLNIQLFQLLISAL